MGPSTEGPMHDRILHRLTWLAALSPGAPPGPARATTAPQTRRRDRWNP
jgi:hypothetical protein